MNGLLETPAQKAAAILIGVGFWVFEGVVAFGGPLDAAIALILAGVAFYSFPLVTGVSLALVAIPALYVFPIL